MSTGKRAYDLLRGYVNREWDRIQGIELDDAQAELNAAMDAPRPYTPPTPASNRPPSTAPSPDRNMRARQVLGVESKANFEDIRHAFEKLNKRSDPANFPANSNERNQAADIQKRVQWAYSVLTENIDSTEKRFKSLEID